MKIDGACHCGKVSFTAEIDPSRVMVCHCDDCQVLSGAPLRAVAVAHWDTLSLTGPTRAYVKVAQSGIRRAQVFCPECGTPLYSAAAENPVAAAIRLGCVKQKAQLAPVLQIWKAAAMPWCDALPDVPASPDQAGFLGAPAR